MRFTTTAGLALCLSLAAVAAPSFAADNPMDHAGAGHNAYLDCLLRVDDQSTPSLVRLVKHCGYDPRMPLDEFVAVYTPLVETDPALSIMEKLGDRKKAYSDYELSFVERMDAIFITAEDPDQADAMLARLEGEAIAKLDAKSVSGANILGSISVARHSTSYWKAVGEASGTTAKRMRWWKWLLVAAADVGGYLLTEDIGTAASASETAYDYLNK